MGNFFSRHKTEHNLNATVQEFELETYSIDVTEKPYYNRLNRTQIGKLNELYGIILDKVAIDHDNPEMKDIRYAVHKLLDRIKERANERGVFSISRVQSCGSMVERTSVWKFDQNIKSSSTEFDFLAILNNFFEREWDSSCPGCIKLNTSPINLDALRNYKHDAGKFISYLNEPGTADRLFQLEIAYCLESLCDCLCVNVKHEPYRTITFSSRNGGCKHCTVDMPTGTLEINTTVKLKKLSGSTANCSLILKWKSKSMNLAAPVGPCTTLPTTYPIGTLPIYEPPHGKTNNLHRRKQRRRSASR